MYARLNYCNYVECGPPPYFVVLFREGSILASHKTHLPETGVAQQSYGMLLMSHVDALVVVKQRL